MTTAATGTPGPASSLPSPPALYLVRVLDSVDERLAGHGSRAYTSPPQPRDDALALVQLVLGGAVVPADGRQRWTGTVAIAGGRRTVTLERADRAG
jgi:hypothetical protein